MFSEAKIDSDMMNSLSLRRVVGAAPCYSGGINGIRISLSYRLAAPSLSFSLRLYIVEDEMMPEKSWR